MEYYAGVKKKHLLYTLTWTIFQNMSLMRCKHFQVDNSIIHNTQNKDTTQMPINGWKDKKDVV